MHWQTRRGDLGEACLPFGDTIPGGEGGAGAPNQRLVVHTAHYCTYVVVRKGSKGERGTRDRKRDAETEAETEKMKLRKKIKRKPRIHTHARAKRHRQAPQKRRNGKETEKENQETSADRDVCLTTTTAPAKNVVSVVVHFSRTQHISWTAGEARRRGGTQAMLPSGPALLLLLHLNSHFDEFKCSCRIHKKFYFS